MAIEVKRLNKENIEEIIPLRVALQKFDYEDNLGIEEELLESKTREFLQENLDKDLFMFGTFVNDELVSTCGLIIFKNFPQADDLSCKVGYITSVYTKENYRGKGYQKKVFLECLNLARDMGITRFKLSTKSPIAMKMYASQGFEEDNHAKKMKL